MLNPLGLICRPLTARPETVTALIRAKGEAEARAYAATQLLDELVTAVGTAPMSTILAGDHAAGSFIAAPHTAWPPLTAALADARTFLGRVR